MSNLPTNQQRQLKESCPHQDWLGIDLGKCDFYVRRSYANPQDPSFVSHEEPREKRPFRRPTPALRRSWELAKEYREEGYNVIHDVQFGVHQLSKPSDSTFFLFIEYVEHEKQTQRRSPAFQRNGAETANPPDEYVPTTVRIEKRRLKVLKALAELKDLPLGQLLEDMIAHAIDGKNVFDDDERKHISLLRRIYGIDTATKQKQAKTRSVDLLPLDDIDPSEDFEK